MRYLYSLIPSIIIFFGFNTSRAQSCQDLAVELSASVQVSPPRITLNWVPNATATQYILSRKMKDETAWSYVMDTLDGTAVQFTDSEVVPGISYEYKLRRSGPNYTGYGYINAGIEIPATESRGTLVLVVDEAFSDPLATEIQRLVADIEGDGWKVVRFDVARTAPVPFVKGLIQDTYNADPVNTRAVFLLGHVPVPYSGDIYPDGHPDHQGAWPADVFYAEMNGTWTDVTVNNTSASDPRNHNVPGDGKYDQGITPNDAELQIGRVDLSNLPSFPSSEEQLMKAYLDKDHAYRTKLFTPQYRGVIDDNFGYFGGEAFAASGYKNMGPAVGPWTVIADDYFTSLNAGTWLWSYACGGGWYQGASGVGSTIDFVNGNPQGVFTMLFGSYFGDWDTPDNFLRAPLASGTLLTSCWSGRPHWQFHHMALGENIGYNTRLSQNNTSLYFSSYGSRMVHIALMGDPTLRNDVVAPVSGVVATSSGTGCSIVWNPSPDPVLGYHIFMKNDSAQDFVRITPQPVTGNSFTDTCLLYPGVYTYMVRGIVLQQTPSGSYYNLGQGIPDTAWNNNDLKVHAIAEYSIQDNVVTFANQSVNASGYLWDFGDGDTSTLEDPVHTYDYGDYTATLIAYSTCDYDTLHIPVSVVTGLQAQASQDVTVYPNPSAGKIRISLNDDTYKYIDICLMDAFGRRALELKQADPHSDIDLKTLNSGLYFILLKTATGQQFVSKVILLK